MELLFKRIVWSCIIGVLAMANISAQSVDATPAIPDSLVVPAKEVTVDSTDQKILLPEKTTVKNDTVTDTIKKKKLKIKKQPVDRAVIDSLKTANLLKLVKPDTTIQLSPQVERALYMALHYDSLMTYSDTMPVNPIFLPIIFTSYQNQEVKGLSIPEKQTGYNRLPPLGSDQWLEDVIALNGIADDARFNMIVTSPQSIKYDREKLPDVPEPKKLKSNRLKNLLTVEPDKLEIDQSQIKKEEVKLKNWISGFQSSIQFSQVHISDNWYQGGESNLNIVSNQVYNLKYDDYKRVLFENTIQWKLGLNNAPDDTVRSIRVNEDLFQINSKFGYKANKKYKWYYSLTLLFKTQLLSSYKANSDEKQAEFLSPGELNLGLGMSYQYDNDPRKLHISVVPSPLSYNLKFVARDKYIDPQWFGIEKGKTQNQYGSSFETTLKWEFLWNMHWNSRFFYFTNYDRIQIDFENSFDFVLNRYFSTRLFVHLRYDDRQPKKERNTYLQLKELLSFGFNYRF